MTKRDLPCSVCGKLMWRGKGSLPEGRATCHPCRRAALPVMAGPDDCLLCHSPLTDEQKAAGNRFCGRACGFRATQIWQDDRPHRRFRRFGAARPSESVDGLLVALQGPCRRQKLSVHVFDDGSPSAVVCPWCGLAVDLSDAGNAWCEHCALLVTLDRPFEVVSDATSSSTRRSPARAVA